MVTMLEGLDVRDAELLARRVEALSFVAGPRVGDFVRFVCGTVRRVSFVTPVEWLPECDAVQTSEGGSFYLGDGYTSFSGGLFPGVPRSSLLLTAEVRYGSVWFFSHDYAMRDNGVDASMPFRVYECSVGAVA